jgi:hypothetical protein
MSAMTDNTSARKTAERIATETKETTAKAAAAVGDTQEAMKDATSRLSKGAQDYTLRVMEMARANTNAAFDYAEALMSVRSPSQFAEATIEYANAQMAALREQSQELGALAQRGYAEVAEPMRAGVSKAFHTGA